MAEPEGFVRLFVDEGPPMAALLSAVLEEQQSGRLAAPGRVSAHYLRKLMTALERDSSDAMPSRTSLPESLSERELEVLVLIAAGKTNQEVAYELFVAMSTGSRPTPRTSTAS